MLYSQRDYFNPTPVCRHHIRLLLAPMIYSLPDMSCRLSSLGMISHTYPPVPLYIHYSFSSYQCCIDFPTMISDNEGSVQFNVEIHNFV